MPHWLRSLCLILPLTAAAMPTFAPPLSAALPEALAERLKEDLAALEPAPSLGQPDAIEPRGFGYECIGEITIGPFQIQKTGRGLDSNSEACFQGAFVVSIAGKLIAAFEEGDSFSSFSSLELDPANDTPELLVTFHSMAVREDHGGMIVVKLPDGRWDTLAFDRGNNGMTNIQIEESGLIVATDADSIFFEGVGAASYNVAFRPVRLYRLRGGRLLDVTSDPKHRANIREHLRTSIELALSNAPLGTEQPEYHSLGFWASYAAIQASLGSLHIAWARILSTIDFEQLSGPPGEAVNEPSSRQPSEARLISALKQNGYISAEWQKDQVEIRPLDESNGTQREVLLVVLEDERARKRMEQAMMSTDTCDSLLVTFRKSGPFRLTIHPIGREETTTGRAISLHCIAPDGTSRDPSGRVKRP